MMTETDSLKCFGQCPTVRQALAKCKRTRQHSGSATIFFRYRHAMWSGPGDELLEHAERACVSSSCEKSDQSRSEMEGSSSNIERLHSLPEAELYVLCRASQSCSM